jgi:hypothetical protein
MPAGCEILKEYHKGLDALYRRKVAPALLARWQKYTLFTCINQAFAGTDYKNGVPKHPILKLISIHRLKGRRGTSF